jgi:hypothetical protein
MTALPSRPRVAPRGPLSAALLRTLTRPPQTVVGLPTPGLPTDAEDRQLSLWLLYELHYRGLAGVDDRWEWQPDLIRLAAELEADLEEELRRLTEGRWVGGLRPAGVPAALAALVAADEGPSLSSYLARQARREQYEEFLVHRSIYHLKEADPHTFAIPRLAGPAKAALVEIQADEYGGGRPEWAHAELFAGAMGGLGLDAGYGAYVDAVPAVTLRWANAMTLFGLHRRFRGAVAGHLAALEMTSSLPNRRYGNGLRRLGFGEETTRFFDEHVEADAVHEQIAAHDLAGRLADAEPELVDDIGFGASVALATDEAVTRHLLGCWSRGASSLRGGARVRSTRPSVTVGRQPA